MSPVRLVLASASPRRADLLRAAGIEFDVRPADIDETMDPEETPDGYVRRVAQLKAEAATRREPGRVILGADTVVLIDYRVLGKPSDEADARRMLRLLSGREHVVMTAVCLINQAGPAEIGPAEIGQAEAGHYVHQGGSKRIQTGVARTTVEFAPLSDPEIDAYIASGEPMGKAGAYAIQGLGSRFVTRIDGSYSNVVGLPVALVYNLCRHAGLLIS
jgi:septum formation protein